MKRNFKKALSLILTACMLLSSMAMMLIPTYAEEPLVKDYDTANDGDILYTVDFRFDDAFTFHYDDTAGKVDVTFSDDGHKMTFGTKTSGAVYYGGFLKDFRITGHVYTISYYIENSDYKNIRMNVATLHDGSRLGITTAKDGTKQALTMIDNGTTGANAGANITRQRDASNNNREYYKVVVDGINMVVKYFVLDTTGNYAWISSINLAYNVYNNYLIAGMYNYDAIASGKEISVGDFTIAKGNQVYSEDQTYRQKYDATANGDVLYDVDFRDNNEAGLVWGTHRPTAGLTATSVSEDGKTLSLNSGAAAAVQTKNAYLPDEALNYGSYTYEFFVTSDKRTGMNVLASNSTVASGGASYYGAGFSYFNGTAANMFMKGSGWANTSDTGLAKGGARVKLEVFVQNQTPDTSDPTKPNVKIEVNTETCTVTNYILNSEGQFIKTASINYSGSILRPVIYPYAYDTATNATFSNVVIKKGLTISGNEPTVLDLKINGEYATEKPVIVDSDYKLPALVEKDYHTVEYQLADGTVINSVADLTLTQPSVNTVELKMVYTPIAVQENVELRGIQTALEPNTENNTTSVRFIGAVDTLDFKEVGFNLYVVYKDKDGNVHETSNENGVDKGTTSVYNSVLAGIDAAVTAQDLGTNYLFAITVNNVPMGEGVQVDFYLLPYVINEGETEPTYCENNFYTCSFVNGEYAPNAPVIE